jgi:hypothetical protein
MSDGQPIQTFRNGACFTDFDGDGKRDLVYGIGNAVKFCLNQGTDTEPVFGPTKDIQLRDGSVISGSSVAVRQSVQVLDFNHDGHLDILTGPGFATILWGDEDNKFTAEYFTQLDGGKPVPSLTSAERAKRGLPVGNLRIKFGTGRATNFFATDWDLDGDYDIIHGNNIGRVILIENIGDESKTRFAQECSTLKCEGNNILMKSGTSNPIHADWDGDGKRDLVVGSHDGTVSWYRNIGANNAPAFQEGVTLVSRSKGEFTDEPLETGKVTMPFVADFNGDGVMDLIVGDQQTEMGEPKELDEKQQAEFDRLNAAVERIGTEQAKALEKFRVNARNEEMNSATYNVHFQEMLAEVELIEDYDNWGNLSRDRSRLMNPSKLTGRIMVYLRKQKRR